MGTARAAAIDGIQDRIDRAVESEHEHTLSESDKWEGEELDAAELWGSSDGGADSGLDFSDAEF